MLARQVVGAIAAGIIGVIMLWIAIPMLKIAYNSVSTVVDTSDPGLEQTLNLGDIVFNSLPMIVFVIIGYTIFAYATERAPFDR